MPHHEFIYHLKRLFPSLPFHTLSTPISRHLKEKFEMSRRKEVILLLLLLFIIIITLIQNKILFRVDSIMISSDVTKSIASQLLCEPLPELRPSTTPHLEHGRRKSAGTHVHVIIIIFIVSLIA